MKTGGMLNPNNDNKINEKFKKTRSLLEPTPVMLTKLSGGLQDDVQSEIYDTLHDDSLDEFFLEELFLDNSEEIVRMNWDDILFDDQRNGSFEMDTLNENNIEPNLSLSDASTVDIRIDDTVGNTSFGSDDTTGNLSYARS